MSDTPMSEETALAEVRRAIFCCLAQFAEPQSATEVWHFARGFCRRSVPHLGFRTVQEQLDGLAARGVLAVSDVGGEARYRIA